MARIEEHMEDCERMLGKPYKEVHKFLDQYAETFPVYYLAEYHRSFLHNKYGIGVVKAIWGLEAERAAKIHIVRDYSELPVKDLKAVDSYLGRALIYFHNMNNLEPQLQPHIVQAWKGKSLVSIALGEER